jgi:hypothetical protein
VARPTKLSPDTQERIEHALQLGATFELAAQYGGIAYNTFNEWRKRGEAELARRDNPRVKPGTKRWEAEQPFVEFYEATKKAEALAAIGWLAKIEKAANDGNWQAAAWKLERRYPERYGRKALDLTSGGEALTIRIEHGGDDENSYS